MSDVVQQAARAALAGELVVFPTDTVYGIAARPDVPEATARLFEAKRRPQGLALPILVSTPSEASEVAVVDGSAAAVTGAGFWPGGLTIVLRRTQGSAGWDLGGDGETVAVRVPDHPVALGVLASTGPLAVTSANLSGQPAPGPDELRGLFGRFVSVFIIDAPPPGGVASTVLDLAHGRPRVLRKGAVPVSDLAEVLGTSIDSLDP
jgi:L-threonylcarbamoyladenylate synthase